MSKQDSVSSIQAKDTYPIALLFVVIASCILLVLLIPPVAQALAPAYIENTLSCH